MSEENQNKQVETTGTRTAEEPKNSNVGSQSETTPIIAAASEAAKKLAEENQRMERNIARMEQLNANRLLGGESEAGKPSISPESQKLEKIQGDVDNILKSYGYKR